MLAAIPKAKVYRAPVILLYQQSIAILYTSSTSFSFSIFQPIFDLPNPLQSPHHDSQKQYSTSSPARSAPIFNRCRELHHAKRYNLPNHHHNASQACASIKSSQYCRVSISHFATAQQPLQQMGDINIRTFLVRLAAKCDGCPCQTNGLSQPNFDLSISKSFEPFDCPRPTMQLQPPISLSDNDIGDDVKDIVGV